jgi:hypothetical protein
MMEGVKLYKHFTEQITRMGPIRRAWFTTFNLDVHFFEKYVLSALMGEDYRELRTPYDYEALNVRLANEEDSLNDDRMEVRVFYDFRAMSSGGKQKQTGVHLHPVNIRKIRALGSPARFRDGVFHPKVVLLETAAGEHWLMASSANLTLGGWSKNRESFFCEKIVDKDEARKVGAFFEGIAGSVQGLGSSQLLAKLNSGRFGDKQDKWMFVSSFDELGFLDVLKKKNEQVPLRIWSPYFADDLHGVSMKLLENDFSRLEIVPAKNETQKIRITPQSYAHCIKDKRMSFLQDRLPDQAREAFVHGKVWLTPEVLAIGSWNMTQSGLGISKTGNNNVEAGILYLLSSQEYEAILKDLPVSKLTDPGHFSQVELTEEKEKALDGFLVSMDLVADWDRMKLMLENPKYPKLIEEIGEDCSVRLPGFGTIAVSNLSEPIDFRVHSRSFLTDRYVELVKNGTTIFGGYIRETGLASRPVNSFGSIDDYLKGWVSERPEDKEELHQLAYRGFEVETRDELSEQTRAIMQSSDQNAWFTSFHAFECILNRIHQCRQYRKLEKMDELKRIGRVLPGSLTELRTHLIELLRIYREERDRFMKSPVYLMFLIEKANHVFEVFNAEIEMESEFVDKIPKLSMEEALGTDLVGKIGPEKLEQWRQVITNTLTAPTSASNT